MSEVNPILSPRFRASASDLHQYTAFAFGVPHHINGFHSYTMSSVYLLQPPVVPFPPLSPGWAGKFNGRLIQPPTHPLRPMIPDNTRGTRITAAAGLSPLALLQGSDYLITHFYMGFGVL